MAVHRRALEFAWIRASGLKSGEASTLVSQYSIKPCCFVFLLVPVALSVRVSGPVIIIIMIMIINHYCCILMQPQDVTRLLRWTGYCYPVDAKPYKFEVTAFLFVVLLLLVWWQGALHDH